MAAPQRTGTRPDGALVLRTGPGADQDASAGPLTLYVSVSATRPVPRGAERAGSMTAIGRILVFTSTEHGSGSERGTTHTYMVDGAAVGLPETELRARQDRHVDARDPLTALVSTYLTQLAGYAVHLSAEQRAELEGPTVELLRSLLTTVPAEEPRDGPPARESLGDRIMEHIRLNLTDRDLSVATVARHHNISERYVYLILSKFGVSFSDWVRLHRLRGAAAELADVDRRPETISSIAHRWGFPDHANFTRAFRREFAVTPRQFRSRNQPVPPAVDDAPRPRRTVRTMPGALQT
jgi:AraC-like DNA-binding protein